MNLENINHSHDHTLEEKVRGLVDELDAYISHFHGGRVEFVSLDAQSENGRRLQAVRPADLHVKRVGGRHAPTVFSAYQAS